MALVLEIPPEQENQIRQAASQAGVSLDTFVLESLLERLSRTQTLQSPNTSGYANKNNRQALSVAETRLLEKINQSLSQIQWERYRTLVAKRQAGTLTPEEQSELIALSDQIEEANVVRIQYVAELAELQQTTLPAMMKKLGLKPVVYAE